MNRLACLIFILLTAFGVRADFAAPDFAYPLTVIGDAEKVLAETNSPDDGLKRVRAVMEIVTAKQAISPDSLYAMPCFIDGMATKESDAAARGLMKLYEARTLYNIYSRSSWRYDNVDAPAEPLPLNPDEWSGDQFRSQISELCGTAIDLLKPYMKQDINLFKDVISADVTTRIFYPYLRDFVYMQTYEMASSENQSPVAETILDLTTKGTPEWAVWTNLYHPVDELMDIYKSCPDGIAGGYLLWKASYSSDGPVAVKTIRDYLASNSTNVMTETLKSRLAELTVPSAYFKVPHLVVTDKEFEIECEYSYTSEVGVKIYKVADPMSTTRPIQKTLVGTFTRKVDQYESNGKVKIPAKLSKTGNYIVYGISDGTKETAGGTASIIASPWIPFALSCENENTVIVADASSGAPAAGVGVGLWKQSRKERITIGKTCSDGYINFSTPKSLEDFNGQSPLLLGSKKDFVYYGGNVAVGTYRRMYGDNRVVGEIMVSRPVYHPGDTVGWSAVVVEKSYNPESTALVEGMTFDAILYDVNGTPVDTLAVTSDSYGRVFGNFVAPTDRLTGRYQIAIKQGRKNVASCSVTVSDFKPPVFELKNIEVNYVDSTYRLTGRAERYTGVAVPDAEVNAGVSLSYRRDMFSSSVATLLRDLPTLSGRTNSDGYFSIDFKMNPALDGYFQCNVNVTNLTGETASGNANFMAGKPYMVMGNVNAEYNVDKPLTLKVEVLDSKLTPVEMKAKWELCGVDSTAKVFASDTCIIQPTGLTVDWSKIPAGEYVLRIAPADTAQFAVTEVGKLTLYSVNRNDVPQSCVLLLPEKEIIAESDSVEVIVGVGRECYVYSIVFGIDDKPQVMVNKLTNGFHTMKFNTEELFGDKKKGRVSFATVLDGNAECLDVPVLRAEKPKKLIMHAETMRDNIIPGSKEEWKIRLSDADGGNSAAAMVATMYNRSLEALTSMSWPSLKSLLAKPQLPEAFSESYGRSGTSFLYKSGSPKSFTSISIPTPAFEFEPESVYGRCYGVSEFAMVKSAAPAALMRNEMTTMDESEGSDESMVEEAEMAVADAGGAQPESDFKYRDAEVLQAFWMPNLTVDTAGVATLSFTMPDAIGSWIFRTTAWTHDCLSAEMMETIFSKKPVMVESSVPRFLRQGDHAKLLFTVINSTDSTQTITTRIEIFDPNIGRVLSQHSQENILSGNSQAIVGIDIDAPTDAGMLGFRVKSSTEVFSDGEQALIPVLESSMLAIDSELFYLNESDSVFSTTIPADKKGNSVVAVQYCQNPIWDAVKTLPGMYDFEPHTACAAASSAYSAMIAKVLLKQFPEIRNALDIWQSNPSDSALVSKLEKNEDLKLALLAQTPFVGAANANTEMMQRLAMTFNEKDIDKVLKTAISTLERLQYPDGGFAWGDWDERSSPWITRSVLTVLGYANEAGFLPHDPKIRNLVERGMRYLDDYADQYGYGYTRLYGMFPELSPSTVKGRQTIDNTVQRIIAGWKKSPTAAKAEEALILHAFGNEAVAKEIMSSVSQFAVSNGKKGVSIPSVRNVDPYCELLLAFAKIEPESELIDGMRQWLILQTQATDDLYAWDPCGLVSAILTTGSKWLTIGQDTTANVTIDGSPLEIDRVEAATGAFSVRLAPEPKKRQIRVVRPAGNQTAYGSVVTVGMRPLNTIKARGNDKLSVKKRLLVVRNGKWVETDNFKQGESVRVQLMVKASDNMEYVTINDDRPAAFEPVDQIPGWINASTLRAYRENGDTSTRIFINRLPKGTHYITYDMTASHGGKFVSGTATIQSQYAPELTARSGATTIIVE